LLSSKGSSNQTRSPIPPFSQHSKAKNKAYDSLSERIRTGWISVAWLISVGADTTGTRQSFYFCGEFCADALGVVPGNFDLDYSGWFAVRHDVVVSESSTWLTVAAIPLQNADT